MSKQKRKASLHVAKKSQRLFFRKYAYKIRIHSHYSMLRCDPSNVSFSWLESIIKNMKPSQNRKKVRNPMFRFHFGTSPNWETTVTRSEIQQAIEVLKIVQQEKKDGARIRQEGYISLFTNNRNAINDIMKVAPDFEIEYWQPATPEMHKELLSDVNKVFVDREYEMPYRVYLSSRGDISGLAKWVKNNPNRVKLTESASAIMDLPTRYFHSRSSSYFYVRNEQDITLLMMAESGAIRRVDQMVYKPQ